MKLLVTGANGFVGKILCQQLVKNKNYDIIAAVRSPHQATSGTSTFLCSDINADTSWQQTLIGVNTVIHLAGRAHVMKEISNDPLSLYRAVNTQGTITLANQAAIAGVRRFIYISTIKVCGEGQQSIKDAPYNEIPFSASIDPYAISKWEAEQALIEISEKTGMEIVIIRPPLIYGPGVKANFLYLMKAVSKGLPLPVAGIKNRRDMIYVGNLVDAIIRCIEHPAAANSTFVLSDGEDVSTPELVRRLAKAFDKPARLIWIPSRLLMLAGTLTGKRATIERLNSSLIINDQCIRQKLDWTPPYSMQDGLKDTAEWFTKTHHIHH